MQEAKLTEMRRDADAARVQQLARDDADRGKVLQELRGLDDSIGEARQMLRRYEAAMAEAKENAAAAEHAAAAAADRRNKVRSCWRNGAYRHRSDGWADC